MNASTLYPDLCSCTILSSDYFITSVIHWNSIPFGEKIKSWIRDMFYVHHQSGALFIHLLRQEWKSTSTLANRHGTIPTQVVEVSCLCKKNITLCTQFHALTHTRTRTRTQLPVQQTQYQKFPVTVSYEKSIPCIQC